MKPIILIIVVLFSAFSLKKNSTEYKPGDKVNNFTLTNAIDNNPVSLFDFADKKGVAVIFTSHSCPFSKIYDERISQLAKEFEEKGIKFLLINPNIPSLSPDDTPAKMTQYAKSKNFSTPYLIDSQQKVCNQFGATRTPEVFLMKNINGNFIIFYKGAIDNNPQVATEANQHYFKDACNSLLLNRAVKVSDKRAVGCMIKRP
ncbi:MAG: thioredoxin family protein [Cytophagaceae bacterium]